MSGKWLRLLGVALASVPALALPAAADSVSFTPAEGYGRLLFSFDVPNPARAFIADGVLTVSFDRATAIEESEIALMLAPYVSGVRRDADGRTFRIALREEFRLHTSTAGPQFAVDLVAPARPGTPPDLPPWVDPEELERRKAAEAVDVGALPELRVRIGEHANFTRVVFDWTGNIQFSAFPGRGRVSIRFAAMARPDFSALASVSPPWVKSAGWRIENRALYVDLETDPESTFRSFRDGTKIVVDVLAPRTDADAYHPPRDEGSPENAKVELVRTLPGEALTPGGQTAPAAAASLAVKVPPETPDAAAPTAVREPEEQQVAAAPAEGTPLPAAAEEMAAAGEPATDGAGPAAEREDIPAPEEPGTTNGAELILPGAAKVPAAIFVRGREAFIVIAGKLPVEPAAALAVLSPVASAADHSEPEAGVSVLRLVLRRPLLVSSAPSGDDLRIAIAPTAPPAPKPIRFVRDITAENAAILDVSLAGASHVIAFDDPVAGDRIVAVPSVAGRAVLTVKRFVEFAAIPTAQGLVLTPFSEDLEVRAIADRVTIGRPDGLALSLPGRGPADATITIPAKADGPAYMDFRNWRGPENTAFLAHVRALRNAAAALPPGEANAVRLELARFYFAHGFAQEALGVIALMTSSDVAVRGEPEIVSLRAAANFVAGRFAEAKSDLEHVALETDPHAAFWRGLANVALKDWTAARSAFATAEIVIHRYPVEWQARLRLGEAEAALGANDLAGADEALKRLPAELPQALEIEADLMRGRLLNAEGRQSEAQPLLLSVERAGQLPAAAMATLARVSGALQASQMTRAQAIDTLERLRFRWRGDALELDTLRALGSLYFAEGRWREGLESLRIAAANYPRADLGRLAQDDMRAAFVRLFLEGEADSLSPIDALALFYDFIDLTPIGRNGDDMIRRLADRLVSVDLLGPAAELLEHQVTNRLEGVGRAQVATRLALIQLLDRKPQAALRTLRETRIARLPDSINRQRRILEARALAALRQYDTALDLVASDESPEAQRLRADIYWESQDWPLAAAKLEGMLGDRWREEKPLADEERGGVLRAAIAYSLAEDQESLDRLRARYGAKMAASADANAFAIVTERIERHGVAFKDLARRVAAIDTLEAFMTEFQQGFDAREATN